MRMRWGVSKLVGGHSADNSSRSGQTINNVAQAKLTGEASAWKSKEKTVKTIITFLSLIAPIAVFAGSVGPISISGDQLQVINSPQIAYLYVSVTGGGCTYATPVLIMDSTNPAAGAMYATLLLAKTTGGNVTISTSGCSSAGYPEITSIYLD
jgi:hypothetical protein